LLRQEKDGTHVGEIASELGWPGFNCFRVEHRSDDFISLRDGVEVLNVEHVWVGEYTGIENGRYVS
jgi:hypothetical protein